MGHSTGSGRGLPRGVAANSRLGRRWRDAQNGDAIETLREYDTDIKKARERRDSTGNAFVRTAAQQEIETLREERRRIAAQFLD